MMVTLTACEPLKPKQSFIRTTFRTFTYNGLSYVLILLGKTTQINSKG